MLYGFLHPDEGHIHVDGVELGRDLVRAKRSIGVCTQDDTFDADFTVEQNLRIAATYFRPRPTGLDERVAELLTTSAASAPRTSRMRSPAASGGLMIAGGGAPAAPAFLDEPTTGPTAARMAWDLMDGLARRPGHHPDDHYMTGGADERRVTVLDTARGRARHPDRVGDLVGEHVRGGAGPGHPVAAWLTVRGRGEPASVLGAWHVPVSGEELAEFARAFPALRYEVRGPTLDDLFLKLSLTP